jgi:flagella basal body P-ring formation protein FlgA
MRRKDCEEIYNAPTRCGIHLPSRWSRNGALIALAIVAPLSNVHAGSIRLFPSAVVVNDKIRIGDLCELRGLSTTSERKLTDVIVADAPAPGETQIIRMDMLRAALMAGGANLATVTLGGATHCTVNRPSLIRVGTSGTEQSHVRNTPRIASGTPAQVVRGDDTLLPDDGFLTLRQAIINHFDELLARYGGRADVVFDRDSEQFLNLSGPTYEFQIRARKSQPLGLIPLNVDVLSEGRIAQTFSVVAQVSLMRQTVVARRAINQGATIQRQEVELIPLTLSRLDQTGLTDPARAIGQRAKRFIPTGSVIDPETLESVPLVTRGQLVTLTSVSGSVRVVTTAKAMQNGLLGDVIRVRSLNRDRVELEAVVLGPGEVRVGRSTTHKSNTTIARGGQS